MAKEIHVCARWESHHVFEVDDDWEDEGFLTDFSGEQLEEMTPETAELVDWTVT